MPKKKPVSTKRGQHHQYKSFWIKLVKDISLTKIDTNVVRKHPDSFEKKKVQFEKRNSDPLYFRQTVCQEFPLLSDGVEFSFWRLSKDNPTLIPLPPEIDNAASLCCFDELNRSSLYIRLQATPQFVSPSDSSTQPNQILDPIDYVGQQADESSIAQGTNALEVVTDIPGDGDGKKQVLDQSSWIFTPMLGSDGQLLILPLHQASPTVVPLSLQPTTAVMEEVIANKGEMLDMLAQGESLVDRAGSAHSLRVPKKRKITSETGEELIEAKQHQSSSAQGNDLINEPIADFRNVSAPVDYTNNFSTTVQGNYLYHDANGIPSANVMDYNSGAVPGQFTHGASVPFNYQQGQLSFDDRGFSASLANFNNRGNRDQPQPIIGHPDSVSSAWPTPGFAMPQMYPPVLPQPDNGAWFSGQMSMARPQPMHTPYLSNVTDFLRLPEQRIIQYPDQQQHNLNLTSLSTQQHLDSRMLQTQQPTSGLKIVSENTPSSENTCTSQENAPNGSILPHAQRLGEIQIGRGYDIQDFAAMNGKMYIACVNKDTLLVYSSKSPFQKEKEIIVNGMKDPRLISAYAEKNCLFILDGDCDSPGCIWSVTDGDEVVCEKFVEDVECCSLFVTRNGELLIVEKNCIHLYTLDGRCFCCVQLPDEIKNKFIFAVKSLRESLYASAAWSTKCNKMEPIYCMVYEVSMDGDILKTFGGREGRGSGQLNGYNYPLAVDEYGRVIVCDERNHRILMLDSNLQLLTIVLDKDDLKDAFTSRMFFYMDANADLIFANEVGGQEITVFRLSQLGGIQSQPNSMLASSSNISSRAMSGTDEFHLLGSIESVIKLEQIRGVATLTDCIYVLNKSYIRVYNCANPYTQKYREDVGSDLWDIAANVSDGCLYVTDKGEKCVWSVGIDLRRRKWLEGIGSPYTLSVAEDGSVLILSNKDQSLDIYDKDGLQQKIRFSCNRTMHLRHAVKLPATRGNETYLVCHGLDINQNAIDDYDYDSDFLSHKVSLVSANGEILLAFGGKFGSKSGQLYLPSHMVLFRDGTILVADCKNNRVLRLDHQLKLQNIPLSKDVQGIEEPFRLCYSEDTGQILIANSNYVDIFIHDDILRCQSQDELSSSDSAANTDASEPEMPYVQLIGQVDNQMQKDKVCRGAAFWEDHMYLIYEEVNTVYVHSSTPPYNRLNQVVVEEMEDPMFIVESVQHNCVYIAEEDGTIWRLLGNGQECEMFLNDVSPKSISVTEEGNLLVVTVSLNDISYVKTYDADGRCIQDIAIQWVISYAVKSGATRVFVNCFCDVKNYSALMEVSLNGVILHTYGPYFEEYFECGGMTSGERDQIFVIDKAHGDRILIFGSRARLIGVLLSKDDHQMKEITGLCYIKDKKQLVVIGSDHIHMFQLSKNRGPKMDGHGRKAALDVEDPVLCSRPGYAGQLLYARLEIEKCTVRAIEKLGDKLYLLYSTYMEVFSPQDLVKKAEFQNGAREIPEDRSSCNINRDAGLWDIAASEIDLCLYVTDRYNHCVWSVTIDHKIKKWLTDIGSPYTLSVTEDGCLCILSNIYKSLDIYDRSGNRMKSIRLPRYMKYLLHAVQTPKGTYIISWTWRRQKIDHENQSGGACAEIDDDDDDDDDEDVFEERHKNCVCSGDSEAEKRGLVCEISSDGSTVRSFCANDPQPSQIDTADSRYLFQLVKPCHLAVDTEGRVFVADYYHSNRVLLLDSQLKFLDNLMEKFPLHGYKAKRLCYDKNMRELTVIESGKKFSLSSYYRFSIMCLRM